MKIRGRYVAQIEIDFDIEHEYGLFPFADMKKKVVDGELTKAIRDIVIDKIIDDYGTVAVLQQYADLYEVKGSNRNGD